MSETLIDLLAYGYLSRYNPLFSWLFNCCCCCQSFVALFSESKVAYHHWTFGDWCYFRTFCFETYSQRSSVTTGFYQRYLPCFYCLYSRCRALFGRAEGQLFFTFTLSSTVIYFVSDYIPFMSDFSAHVKLAISLLIGTIFVARSPVSAIAIINEMRAKGPFTKTVIGVVVVKEFLVIILFTICSAIANVLITGVKFDAKLLLVLIGELGLSFFLGYVLGKGINLLLSLRLSTTLKAILLLVLGYSVFVLAHQVHFASQYYLGFNIYIEPLLICILGGFYIVNFSDYRREFSKIIEKVIPLVYILFFTLIGASLSLDAFSNTFLIAIFLFFIRLIVIAIGTFVGGVLANDPTHTTATSWMPYVTQAGISLGLVSIVSQKYPEWGVEFGTILITIVVLNLFVGPPLFKWSILKMGESHLKHNILHEKLDKNLVWKVNRLLWLDS